MVEITDEDSAKAWLETQPKQVCVAMAARAALRGVSVLGTSDPAALNTVALSVFRALLISVASGSAVPFASTALENAAGAASLAGSQTRAEFDSTRSEIAQIVGALTASDAVSAAAARSNKDVHHFASLALSACLAAVISSTETARSGADAAASALFAFKRDTEPFASKQKAEGIAADELPKFLFRFRVWQHVDEPEGLANARAAFLRFLDADPAKWDFWARWYRGMFDGQPMDWALQRAVALIPDDVWNAGPEAVAARIAEIERDFKGEPLDQDALRSHVWSIAKASDFHADAAESVATTLDTAIRAYCQLAEANELPEGFAQFTRLESGFRAISVTLRQPLPAEDKTAELQAQINDLHGIVGTLQRELSEARAQLVDARLNVLEAERQRRWGTALRSTLADVSTIGAFGLGALAFFGVKAEDFGYDAVRRDAIALAEEYAAPDRSPRPVPRPTAAPDKSPRPEPRQTD